MFIFWAVKQDSSLAFTNISVMDFIQTIGEKALLQWSDWYVFFFFNSESRLWKNNNSSRQKVHFALRKRKIKKKARGARPHWDPFKKGFGSRESVRWGMHRWEGRRLSTPVLMQIFEYTWKIHFFAPFSPAKCVGGECESCCIDWLILYKEYKLLLE